MVWFDPACLPDCDAYCLQDFLSSWLYQHPRDCSLSGFFADDLSSIRTAGVGGESYMDLLSFNSDRPESTYGREKYFACGTASKQSDCHARRRSGIRLLIESLSDQFQVVGYRIGCVVSSACTLSLRQLHYISQCVTAPATCLDARQMSDIEPEDLLLDIQPGHWIVTAYSLVL